MKILALFMFLSFLASSAQAYQGEDACASYPNISVEVRPVFDEPEINTSASLSDIQKIASDKANSIPHGETVTPGVTRYSPVIEFVAPILARPMEDGSYCARVERVNATIGYRNVTVYVAREFGKGSCAFRHVMEHEMKHVSVNRDLLQEYTRKMRDKLAAHLKIYGLFRVQNPTYAEKLLRDNVGKLLKDMSEDMVKENDRRQKMVDTPEEYARNNTVCGGEISRITNRYIR